MMDDTFKELPILKHFKELRVADKIYSVQYGTGEVQSLYSKDEIIVCFASLRKRLSVSDMIRKIPAQYFKPLPKSKVEVFYEGEKITLKELKKKNRAEREKERILNELAEFDRKREERRTKSL